MGLIVGILNRTKMVAEREQLTVLEQLHLAALINNTSSPVCEIDYEDESGLKTIFGLIFYFTNTTVCFKDGRTLNIKNIRKVIY